MSEGTVRKARLTDLPQLQALRRKRSYTGSVLYDEEQFYQGALDQLKECLPRLEELADWRLFVLEKNRELLGYVLFTVDEEHGVTHQLQARLLDFAVFSFDDLSTLIERSVKIVAAFENEYMVVDLLASDRRTQLWFYRCGFRAEQQRSAKLVPRGFQGASSPAYRVRQARPDDLPGILEVHSAYTPSYLPAGRDTDLETVEFRYQLTYLGLDLDASDGSVYLMLEEVETGALAGYVFLKQGLTFGQTPSYYMYDIAVAPDFANRGLSKYLVGAAESVTGKEGGFLYGDGSLNTPVIASWHKQMGAVHDSTLYGLDCRPKE